MRMHLYILPTYLPRLWTTVKWNYVWTHLICKIRQAIYCSIFENYLLFLLNTFLSLFCMQDTDSNSSFVVNNQTWKKWAWSYHKQGFVFLFWIFSWLLSKSYYKMMMVPRRSRSEIWKKILFDSNNRRPGCDVVKIS